MGVSGRGQSLILSARGDSVDGDGVHTLFIEPDERRAHEGYLSSILLDRLPGVAKVLVALVDHGLE